MAALGELPSKKGNVQVKGKVSYSSQEPWVFNGSLKYNVTFGQEFDEAKYRKVLHVCALERVSTILTLSPGCVNYLARTLIYNMHC